MRLCELFPDDPNWMAVVLRRDPVHGIFSEAHGPLHRALRHAGEFHLQGRRIPATARAAASGATREAFREQVLNGVKVGEHHYVRLFPVWFEFRGNNGTMLAENKAIAAAAHLRGNLELANLAERNLEWVVGRNPFVESLMWGEGYDYAPQYTAMSGDIVGALPVGIQAHRNADAPYWPTENCHNWKEVWVHPVGRWIWLMRDLAGPAALEGSAKTPVQVRDISTGRISRIATDPKTGRFHSSVPQGEYELTAGALKRQMTVLPGESYSVNFDGDSSVEFSLSSAKSAAGVVTLHAVLTGTGHHTIALRTDNLAIEPAPREVDLKPGVPQAIEWQGHPAAEAPWIAVAIPDHQMLRRKELTGR